MNRLYKDGEITMPFGKYKDRAISTIPSGYLKWMAENMEDGELCYAADEEYRRRSDESSHFWTDDQ